MFGIEKKFLNGCGWGTFALMSLNALASPVFGDPGALAGKPNLKSRPATGLVLIADPAGPAEVVGEDMTAAELEKTIRNFRAQKIGDDPNSRLQLYGMLFEECAPLFTFSQAKGNGFAGFRIGDGNGRGRECMARLQKSSCGPEHPCVALSSSKLASFTSIDLGTLNGGKDAKLGLLHVDPNQDPGLGADQVWEPLPGGDLAYRSRTTINAEKEELAAAARAARNEKLREQVASCTKTSEDRMKALSAARVLKARGLMDLTELQKLEKKFKEQDLREATEKFKKASVAKPEELDESAERLLSFAAETSDERAADGIATLFHEKAKQLAQSARDPKAIDRAAELISSAQGISNVSPKTEKALERDQLGLQVDRFQLMARVGQVDPENFGEPYGAFMQDLGNQINDCFTTGMFADGMGNDGNNCGYTIQAYNTALQIPQIAQASYYERYMFQMRMQQQMMQAMGGSMGAMPGMPGTPGMTGAPGAAGSPFFF